MKYGEFMARLRQKKDLPHVFLLAGKETYFLRKAQERIVQLLFIRKEDMDQSLQKFNGNVELDTLLGTLETVPFFAEKSVVLVQGTALFKAGKAVKEKAEKKKDKSQDKLLALLEDMPDYSYLIFIAEDAPDKRKKLYKAVEKHGLVLEAEPVRPWNIGDWLTGKLNAINKRLDKEAYEYFQGAVSVMQEISLDFLDSEFEKLALYSDKPVVTKQELVRVFAGMPEVSSFALLDAVSQRRTDKALSLLHRRLADGVYVTVLLALLTRHVRQLWQARVLMQQGIQGKALAKPLELNPFIAEKLGQAARGFSDETLKKAMLELVDADYLLKTGQAGEELLEHAVIMLCKDGGVL